MRFQIEFAWLCFYKSAPLQISQNRYMIIFIVTRLKIPREIVESDFTPIYDNLSKILYNRYTIIFIVARIKIVELF